MLRECKIFRAKTAGFCFGVDRALKIVYNILDNRNDVVTLGPIIHNRNVVDDLEARGCKAVTLDEVTAGQTVIIRSHGVSREVYGALAEKGAEIVDATCPFVERIHKTALEMTEGRAIPCLSRVTPSSPRGRGHTRLLRTASLCVRDTDELKAQTRKGLDADDSLRSVTDDI